MQKEDLCAWLDVLAHTSTAHTNLHSNRMSLDIKVLLFSHTHTLRWPPSRNMHSASPLRLWQGAKPSLEATQFTLASECVCMQGAGGGGGRKIFTPHDLLFPGWGEVED